MSVLSFDEMLAKANRRILVAGSGGTGKTTLSISASHKAGDTIPMPSKTVLCDDVWVIQGDEEGVVGAYDAGLEPGHITDMCTAGTWAEYQKLLAEGLKVMHPKILSGLVKFIVIDMGLPNKLVNEAVSPENQKEWAQVAAEGGKLYRALTGLRGVTVIANCQLKAASSPGETQQAIDAANAKAIGGERSTYAVDLQKGIVSLWKENCSIFLTREVKRTKNAKGEIELKYLTHTQSGPKYEAKARFRSVLQPVEPGSLSLRAILNKCYGGRV